MQMRCDFIEVRIVKDAHMPRFTMRIGEVWTVRKIKVTELGFPLGGGFIEANYYEVAK
jgi:hypothetical protein